MFAVHINLELGNLCREVNTRFADLVQQFIVKAIQEWLGDNPLRIGLLRVSYKTRERWREGVEN